MRFCYRYMLIEKPTAYTWYKMAPPEGKTDSSIFEGWNKWQIALAVGAPVCLGLAGLWYYKRTKQSDGKSPDIKKSKVSPTEKVTTPDSNRKNTSGKPAEPESKVDSDWLMSQFHQAHDSTSWIGLFCYILSHYKNECVSTLGLGISCSSLGLTYAIKRGEKNFQ